VDLRLSAYGMLLYAKLCACDRICCVICECATLVCGSPVDNGVLHLVLHSTQNVPARTELWSRKSCTVCTRTERIIYAHVVIDGACTAGNSAPEE
jgi:hypothetical protein